MPRLRDVAGDACRQCGDTAIIQGRNEPLCRLCFERYVRTKVVKRMEQFRVRNTELGKHRSLLLPFSFGVSSLSLLAILDSHLQSQLSRTGRTGFNLHVLHIQFPDSRLTQDPMALESVKLRFPRHTYHTVPLGSGDGQVLTSTQDSDSPVEASSAGSAEANAHKDAYTEFLSSIPSATSRMDMQGILLTRTAVTCARTHGCEGILWGDSTTKLAQKVLAETAKGRGFSLPWQIADGPSPWGVAFYYPMRDLLKKELLSFSSYIEPPLTPLIQDVGADHVVPVASRNGSVDTLMRHYFESVEDQYPSIVANVVRTTAKLEMGDPNASTLCQLCSMYYREDSHFLDRPGITHSGSSRSQVRGGQPKLCYGCTSALPQESLQHLPV